MLVNIKMKSYEKSLVKNCHASFSPPLRVPLSLLSLLFLLFLSLSPRVLLQPHPFPAHPFPSFPFFLLLSMQPFSAALYCLFRAILLSLCYSIAGSPSRRSFQLSASFDGRCPTSNSSSRRLFLSSIPSSSRAIASSSCKPLKPRRRSSHVVSLSLCCFHQSPFSGSRRLPSSSSTSHRVRSTSFDEPTSSLPQSSSVASAFRHHRLSCQRHLAASCHCFTSAV